MTDTTDTRPALSYRGLPEAFYQPLEPTGFDAPRLVLANDGLASGLGLAPGWLASPGALDILSGAATLSGKPAIAMAYSGHQFGQFSPLLGDGRARLVGDIEAPDGTLHELHLKGTGRTRYSRGMADGKATLASALREYIVSEGMAALGVASSRALAVTSTGEQVLRQQGPEPGAVLARTARSHVRVGSFQFAAASGDTDLVRALADHVIRRLYPEVEAGDYAGLYDAACQLQAGLIAQWMSLGFIHGVMNTDNTALSGETIDYGPCAFVDTFRPDKVFSSIDQGGRYAWNRQAEMAQWNLARLAECLLPLLADSDEAGIEIAGGALTRYAQTFQTQFRARMAEKLGLAPDAEGLAPFIEASFRAMAIGEADFTRAFRGLTRHAGGAGEDAVLETFVSRDEAASWLADWRALSGGEAMPQDRLTAMQRANPVRIPRNHRVEAALAAAVQGDIAPTHDLLRALAEPFVEDASLADFEAPPEPEEIVQATYCGT